MPYNLRSPPNINVLAHNIDIRRAAIDAVLEVAIVNWIEASSGVVCRADLITLNARLLKGVPDELNPLYPVNRMCFLLKRFLGAHPGFDRDDLQGYLNLFHVIANPPEDKMEKAAMVLDRAMQCPKTVRFRSFYNVKSR